MEIKRVFERDEQLISSLVTVWESSIRATHDFFSETNIREITEFLDRWNCTINIVQFCLFLFMVFYI